MLRRRAKPRRFKTPRCVVRGCKRPQMMDERCRSHAKAEADKMWCAEVRAKGECEARGMFGVKCGGALQAAHGFPRTYLRTRHIMLNGFALCAGHHRWFTSYPIQWTAFMQERLGTTVYE